MPKIPMLRTVNVALTFLMTILVSFAVQAYEGCSSKIINVGLFGPFSGSIGKIGNDAYSALLLASQRRDDLCIRYKIHKLNQPLSAESLSEQDIASWVKNNNLDSIITLATTRGLLVKDIASKYNVLHVSVASDTNIADGKFNYINFSPTVKQVEILVDQFRKENIKSVSLIHVHHQWSDPVVKELLRKLKQTNIKVIDNIGFDVSKKDFKTIVSSLTNKSDAYFVLAFTEHLQKLLPEMKSSGKDKLYSITTFNPQDKIGNLSGLQYVDATISPAFIRMFNDFTGVNPSTDAAYAYDSFNIIADVLAQSKDKTSFSAAPLMLRAKGLGAMGPYSVEPDGVINTKSSIKRL